MKELYCKTVELEANTLLNMANQKVVPRAMKYLETLSSAKNSSVKTLKNFAEKYENNLSKALEELETLEAKGKKCTNCTEACKVRADVNTIGENLRVLCGLLEKDSSFPDLDDFLIY